MRATRSTALLIAGSFLLSGGALTAATVEAVVKSVTGSVEFAGPGSASFAPLLMGQQLPVGSTVRTGDDGKAVIVTTPGSAIEVGNGSNLKITALAFSKSGSTVTEQKAHLELTSGVVSALIDHNTPKVTDFTIQTPQGAAAARGTFYAVYVIHGKTYIGVKQGKVGAAAYGDGT
jgi:hypothetical protein